ncbi:hypothetical protein H0H92_000013 [Tricholoma furcatifolium]|nr:hypothetical protein H0H92_000013 [Tricholoma furcatifolium]
MFKFDFELDNADIDDELSSQLANARLEPKERPDVSLDIKHEAFAEISITTVLDRLPDVLSYSPLPIPVLTSDTRTTDKQIITLSRRDLFDARFQLITQSSTDNASNEDSGGQARPDALDFVEAPSDLLPGVYEGGLKTWECSVDLAGYVVGLGHAFSPRGKRIIEIGCGTAVPSMCILRKLFSSPLTDEDVDETEIHLQDYNASVIELVSIPNILLTWYTSPAAASFRETQPPPEVDDETETITPSLHGPGDLFINPALKEAFLDCLKAYKISLRFFSGSWLSFPVEPYDIVLTSETIYRSESLASLLTLLKGAAAQKDREHLCLVAAKVLYFGVGGGVGEFVGRVKEEGGSIDNVWEVAVGVGRRIMSVHWK